MQSFALRLLRKSDRLIMKSFGMMSKSFFAADGWYLRAGVGKYRKPGDR